MKSPACFISSEGGIVLQYVGQGKTSSGRSPCAWTHPRTFAPTSPLSVVRNAAVVDNSLQCPHTLQQPNKHVFLQCNHHMNTQVINEELIVGICKLYSATLGGAASVVKTGFPPGLADELLPEC
ncbi:hypothetical protein CDAR_232191 [Caerostris darwini]|uniref:Uncharacterized protein n=1 Tax=Caerostris darwini TaxID=1538125 RepID=A0AAV4UJ43_9ARAC|nr:hypothetical protein CDAR_232191 [Caerostris darwini]